MRFERYSKGPATINEYIPTEQDIERALKWADGDDREYDNTVIPPIPRLNIAKTLAFAYRREKAKTEGK